jgi:hypothetical protein
MEQTPDNQNSNLQNRRSVRSCIPYSPARSHDSADVVDDRDGPFPARNNAQSAQHVLKDRDIFSQESVAEAEFVLNISVLLKNAYHDFVGEEVGERWDPPVADVGLRVDVEVLEPHLDRRVVDPNSANIEEEGEHFSSETEYFYTEESNSSLMLNG